MNMNDEILVQFICLHVHGGVVDLVWGGGEGRLIKTFPTDGGSIKTFFFLLVMNLFDWSITHKKNNTPHFGRLLK
jgi:hypothetical protein